MSYLPESQTRTRMFARVLGPFFAIVPVITAVRAHDMRTLLSNFGANPLWAWVTGAFLLMGGLLSSRSTSTGEALPQSSCPSWAGFLRCADSFFWPFPGPLCRWLTP